ncbi:MAG: hypothetical protein ACRDCW_02885 [Sarcina sp.]
MIKLSTVAKKVRRIRDKKDMDNFQLEERIFKYAQLNSVNIPISKIRNPDGTVRFSCEITKGLAEEIINEFTLTKKQKFFKEMNEEGVII